MVDYISRIMFRKGLDKNDGSCDNVSKQAKRNSAHFACQAENCTKTEGVFCPIYNGRDAPSVFVL